jgi:PTH2 family peptidyl-tRNA hydrolase
MKQVIVIRTDLGMRKGKMVAQGAHASLGAVMPHFEVFPTERVQWRKIRQWLDSDFKKICVRVESEEQLLEIHQAAKDAGLIECLITDAGLTEFDGVPTLTCCAVGPDTDENLDPITGALKLL